MNWSACWVAAWCGVVWVGCLPRDEELGRKRPSTESTKSASTRGASGSSTAAVKNPRSSASGSARPAAELQDEPAAKVDVSADPAITQPFTDTFDRPNLGQEWRTSASGAWRIKDGQLCGRAARNRPLWLARRLPENAQIEFDAVSNAADGDIKVELWGDGLSGATGTSYTNATSYIAIFGGWKNSLHVLARLDEHGKDRKELKLVAGSEDPRQHPVELGRVYRFKIERQAGKELRWYVDDLEIHAFDDPEPLRGEGHEHFAFNNWDVQVCFDNLQIRPLE